MTRKLRNIVVATAMATILAVGGGAAAHATTVAFASNSKKPSASGSAIAPENGEVTIDGATSGTGITPLAVVNVGGGTWNYGSAVAIWPPKTCWSNYVHSTKYHSSTAVIGQSNVKVYANAGSWSNANTWAGAAYTCYAYWATY